VAKSPKSKSEPHERSDPLGDAFQLISKRRWDILMERWRSYMPAQLADMPNAYQPLSNEQIVISRVQTVRAEDAFETVEDAPVIRTLIFETARFCAERSLYFTRIAENLVVSGQPTGALTASYLAMMFGARSVQCLLGIHYCYVKNQSWLIDCWPEASETTSQGRLRDWTAATRTLISNRRMGHEHHWKLFIRLRAITTRLPIEDNALAVFRRLKDHSSYSADRNDIQYNDRWPYPDLDQDYAQADIGILPADWDVRLGDFDHALKMAQILAFSSASMILSIVKPLPKFQEYSLELRQRLAPEWHPLMNLGALANALAQL
jgi:hypothetical protein